MKQTLWCCVGFKFTSPCYDWSSLSYKRTDSIKKFITGSSWNWIKWKSKGWKCIKVSVEIKPLN
jgi:hypothetical protein